MEVNNHSFVSLKSRWGWRLALILVLGIVAVGTVFYAGSYLFIEDFGVIAPTRSYANEVGSELILNIGKRIAVPSELFRWRSQGEWDAKPEFSKAALFWFTYNTSERTFDIHNLAIPSDVLTEVVDNWKRKLTQVIDSTLAIKQKGALTYQGSDGLGEYDITGSIYNDEPKIVGVVTDYIRFRTHDLPELLLSAKESFPLLETFTTGPESQSYPSPMFILIRDRQDSVIAQLGSYSQLIDHGNLGKLDYIKEYPFFSKFGFGMEIVVPHCNELIWFWFLSRGFYILIIVWMITLILWARAEIKLKKHR